MSADELDAAASGTPKRKFIAGVYVYCDHWCERCRFQPRCRLYRDIARYRAAVAAGKDEAAAAAADLDHDDEEEDDDATVSPSQRAEFLALVEAANREPSPEEAARIDAAWNRQLELRTAHPLSVAAREYADIAANVTAIIRLMLEARGDALALAAVDTIERFAYFVAIKTWRATGGLVRARPVGSSSDDGDEDDIDDENGPAHLQSDSNGCAKLVRLIIAESRDAWQVLMQPGIATADGVPAAMARRLDELDAAVAAAFPRAMEFVRMGFDEDL